MKPFRIALFFCLLVAGLARADKIVLVAGSGTGGDGPAIQAKLVQPFGIAADTAGNFYIVEMAGGERVRKLDAKGMLTTIAGTGTKGYSGDDGPAAKAQVNGIHNLAIAPNGDIYLADTWNSRTRKIDAKTGVITTIAGTGEKGYSGDGGPAKQAKTGNVYCASLDPKGENLYLADLDNKRIRKVDLKTGIITTVAGNGERGVPKDGDEAAKSPLVDPRAVCADDKGNVWVLERGGNALRVVDAAGKIRTVVGTGQKGSSGDDGPALKATLNGPKHLCMDKDGSVLIADTENHIVRRYTPKDGKIVRVAGSGKKGTAGVGGDPLQIEMNQPHGVFVHPSGVLYITDSSNGRVLKIER